MLKNALLLLGAGMLIGIASQCAKYVLPDPEMRVVICMATDNGIEACESAKEILDRARNRKDCA